jgi:bilin biosynthesis protein
LALGELKNPRAVYPLVLTLHDEDRTVRDFSAGALGKIGDRRAVKPLIHALQSDDYLGTRMAAAEALGKIKDPQAVEPLINALKDTAPYVRQNAAVALEKLGDPRALQALEAAAAHDENTSVRRFAQGAVREIKKKNRGKKPPKKPEK